MPDLRLIRDNDTGIPGVSLLRIENRYVDAFRVLLRGVAIGQICGRVDSSRWDAELYANDPETGQLILDPLLSEEDWTSEDEDQLPGFTDQHAALEALHKAWLEDQKD